MRPFNRLTLGNKLFISIGGVVILVTALLLLASYVIHDVEIRFEIALTNEVGPLVKLNQLQSRINGIRVLEIELSKLSDLFAIFDQLELIKSERKAFAQDLNYFNTKYQNNELIELKTLEEHWQRYEMNLENIAKLANTMNLKLVQDISTFESAGRFKAISRILKQLSIDTELRAKQRFNQSVSRYKKLSRLFFITSLTGLIILGLWTGIVARSISMRVLRLRNMATQIADGSREKPIAIPGNDELTDLGFAFNIMHNKIKNREQALQQSHDQLEVRVVERTYDLNEANKSLSLEIEERRRAEVKLKLLSQAVEQSPVIIIITDIYGKIEYVNQAFIDCTQYSLKDITDYNPLFLSINFETCIKQQEQWNKIISQNIQQQEILNRRADGSLFWVDMRISPVLDTDNNDVILHFLVVMEDITVRKYQNEKILYQAYYDNLTDLPNRMMAMERLSKSIIKAQNSGSQIAVIYVDLDDFKKVNDTLGHQAGDDLLVEAANRLKQTLRKADMVARLGGDEFLIITGSLTLVENAKTVTKRVIEAFAKPFTLREKEIITTCSLGLAMYPHDGCNSDILLRNADIALYGAKEAGRNT